MEEAPRTGATNGVIDQLKRKSQELRLFDTKRLTAHQYMRNFAIGVGVEVAMIPLIVMLAFVLGISSMVSGHTAADATPVLNTITLILTICFVVVTAWIQICASVQRFHDMGQSGMRVLLLFIPLVNFYFFYLLLTRPTSPDADKYGESSGEVANKRTVVIWFIISWLILAGSNLV